MALTLKPRKPEQPEQPEQNILAMQIDTSTPAARRALDIGLLEAKTEAYEDTGKLLRFGRPLLLAVIGVSFLHIFDTVSTYKPADVDSLHIAPWLHHISTGALVLAIDAVLAYYIAAGNAVKMAAGKAAGWPLAGFIGLTFALNMAYMVRYAPHIDAGFRASMQQALDTFFVFALSAFVPAAIIAVEYASHLVKTARLKLLVETRALSEKINGPKPVNSLGSQNGLKPATPEKNSAGDNGGRKPFLLEDMQAALINLGEATTTRAKLQAAIGCGDTTIDKLISEGLEKGLLERVGRGTYRISHT